MKCTFREIVFDENNIVINFEKNGFDFVELILNVMLVREIAIEKVPPLMGRVKRDTVKELNCNLI